MKALACICGDCLHWELLDDGHGLIGQPAPILLKCKTCGRTVPAVFGVDPHEHLVEVEVKD